MTVARRLPKHFAFLLLIPLLTLAADVRADAVLHPGTLSGTINLQGVAFTGGTFQANSGQGFSASLTPQPGLYSLTVEGSVLPDGTSPQPDGSTVNYTRQLQVNIPNSGGWIYLSVDRSTPISVPVTSTMPPSSPAIDDYVYTVPSLAVTLNVTGGTVNSVYVNASASQGTESYSDRTYVGAVTSFPVPMIASSAVRVYGSANVTTTGGVTQNVPLAQQTIALGPGGTPRASAPKSLANGSVACTSMNAEHFK